MFDLSDKRNKRRKTIFGYAHFDPGMGVVLAAMDFEWTCRRAILALSKTPTTILYEKYFKGYTTSKKLNEAWDSEVLPYLQPKCSLDEVVCKNGIILQQVLDAMQCRNVVVHGTESRVSAQECRWAVCLLEYACDNVATFVHEQGDGKDIFKRISRARTKTELVQDSEEGKKLRAWHDRIQKQIARCGATHWIRTGKMVTELPPLNK